jgi:hypothetical protein
MYMMRLESGCYRAVPTPTPTEEPQPIPEYPDNGDEWPADEDLYFGD